MTMKVPMVSCIRKRLAGEMFFSCPGNTDECTYMPEHIWNVTCVDPYAEEFLGSEAFCQAACSNDDECNFFWGQ